jgi:hypothetical protein
VPLRWFNTTSRRIWWGTRLAQLRLADLVPTVGLTYDASYAYSAARPAMTLWQHETLLIKFPPQASQAERVNQ